MVFVVRNSSSQCVAIIPMILTQRSIGPLKIRTLSLIGADPAITEIRASLIQPGFEAQVAWATLRKIAGLRRIHWIHWGNISGKFAETLAVGAELSWQDPSLVYVLDLPVSWEALRSSLKRNVRQSIRHGYNSLKRKGIEFEFRVAAAPADVPPALEIFFNLHAERAQVKGTVPHANHFEREVSRDFLRSVCRELAARNMVRAFQMVIAGKVVAIRIGFVIQDSLYLYYSGFDPRWAYYGVMTTTLTEAIKYAIGERIATVNFSSGEDVSKTRWEPRELCLDQAVQVGASAYSKFAWKSFQRAGHARNNSWFATRLLQFASRDWG